jgi:tetratricopeptide (TPR) repeat protein
MMDGFLKFNQAVMAESWVYLASAGFFLIFSLSLLKLKKLGLLICAILIFYFGALTVYNNSFWKDAITFDKNTLRYLPDHSLLRRILIDDYLDAGFYNEALSDINRLAGYYGEHNLLVNIERGNYYFFTKNAQKAIECYNKVLVKSFLTLYRTAACYKMLGKFDAARSFAEASFVMNPYYEPNKTLLKELNNAV